MHLEDAENLALTLMEDHGLGSWHFRFDNAKARCGACFYSRHMITLSRHYVQRNNETEVRDTILHEIAHAFAGRAAGHGVHWQRAAIQLGARPERCASAEVDMPEGNVEGVCAPGCKARHVRHRMPPARLLDAYSCNRCRTPVTWVRVK